LLGNRGLTCGEVLAVHVAWVVGLGKILGLEVGVWQWAHNVALAWLSKANLTARAADEGGLELFLDDLSTWLLWGWVTVVGSGWLGELRHTPVTVGLDGQVVASHENAEVSTLALSFT
jgi:hypothetical protein